MNTRCWPRLLLVGAAVALGFLAGCSKRQTELGDAPAAGTLLIDPNSSVGPIRAGMSTQQVVAVIGEPARRTANALIYPKLGLAVMPGADGIVQVVMCGDVTGLQGPFVKAFHGRTPQGLGMESSREEIIEALGEPSEAETFRGGQEALRYTDHGITFTLQKGKVHHMIVRLHALAAGPETNAVTIDLE